MMNSFKIAFSTLLLFTSVTNIQADDAVKTLDPKGKTVARFEVSNSFGGFRDTLIFYTMKDQRVVLKLVVDNKNLKFPVSGTIYQFGKDVTEDGLKKWLNNQHSDGLFPDVPNPVSTHKLPGGSAKVTAHELKGETTQPFGKFKDYAVKVQVREAAVAGKFKVKDFDDKATVHVKVQ